MRIRYLLIIQLLFPITMLLGQDFVFPGDANNNGLVDHFDVLPIGYAYGSVGPIREANSPDEPQVILQHWASNFPGGLNFIHADANADGMVSFFDFAIMVQNQDLQQGTFTPLPVLDGVLGIDPILSVNEGQNIDANLISGEVEIPISFNQVSSNIAVNGLAFTVCYPANLVQDISFTFSEEWLNTDAAVFQFQRADTEKLRVALTRYGQDPIPGGGLVGTVKMIIIDDLICLLEEEVDSMATLLAIDSIQVVDGAYSQHPVIEDSIMVFANMPMASTATSDVDNVLDAQVFPNPSEGPFTIQSTFSFEKIELINPSGQVKLLYYGVPIMYWQSKYFIRPSGLYFLRLYGSTGQSLLPLVTITL